MNIVDIIIVIIFALGMYSGVKKGFLRGTLSFIGLVFVLILSFLFKDYISKLLISFAPFFKFSGSYKGLSSLNILIYEGISFLIIFMLLFGVLELILKLSDIFQKIIDNSLVFTLPSKILGMLVGFINALIISFVVLFFMIQLSAKSDLILNSKLGPIILERTAILSNVTSDVYISYEEINDVVNDCKNNKDKMYCNTKITNTMIKYDIISRKDVLKLIEKDKLNNIIEEDLIY